MAVIIITQKSERDSSLADVFRKDLVQLVLERAIARRVA